MARQPSPVQQDVENGSVLPPEVESIEMRTVREQLEEAMNHVDIRKRAGMTLGVQNSVVVVSFRNLQTVRIMKLQDELLDLQSRWIRFSLERCVPPDVDTQTSQAQASRPASRATETGELSNEARDAERALLTEIDNKLKAYAQAIRDHETLSKDALDDLPPYGQLIGQLDSSTAEPLRELITGSTKLLRLYALLPRIGITLIPKLAELVYARLIPWIFGWNRVVREAAAEEIREKLRKECFTEETYDPQIRMEDRQHVQGYYREQLPERKLFRAMGFLELDMSGRRQRRMQKAFWERLALGLFGVLALIIPMIIMVLLPTRVVALVVTSVMTVSFATIIAFGAQDIEGKDVIGVTAAYAAVLVVFVGTSISDQ